MQRLRRPACRPHRPAPTEVAARRPRLAPQGSSDAGARYAVGPGAEVTATQAQLVGRLGELGWLLRRATELAGACGGLRRWALGLGWVGGGGWICVGGEGACGG